MHKYLSLYSQHSSVISEWRLKTKWWLLPNSCTVQHPLHDGVVVILSLRDLSVLSFWGINVLDVLTSVQFDITYEVNYDSQLTDPIAKLLYGFFLLSMITKVRQVCYNRGTSAIERDILNFWSQKKYPGFRNQGTLLSLLREDPLQTIVNGIFNKNLNIFYQKLLQASNM